MNTKRHLSPRSLLLVLLLAGISQTGSAEEYVTIEAEQANDHVGQLAMVCGIVVDTHYAQTVTGRPTFLNFGEPYPDAVFTAVLWEKERELFPYSPSALLGMDICVYGKISRFRGMPQIKLMRPEQVGARAMESAG